MNLPKTVYSFLWYFVKRQPVAFSFIFIVAIAFGLNDVAFPYFVKLIINTLYGYQGPRSGVYSALVFPVGMLLGFWFVAEVIVRAQGIVLIYAFPNFRANIRYSVFDYVKYHSHEYFSDNFAGNIAKKMADLPNSAQMMLEILFFNFVTVMVGFVFALILMWIISPIFSGILCAWFVLHMGITFLFLWSGNQKWEVHAEAVSTLSGKIIDTITNILNVRLFSRGAYESQYLKKFQHDEIQKSRHAMWLMEIMRICQSISGILLIMAMFATLTYGWVHGWVTLGDFSQISMQTLWLCTFIWYMSYQLSFYVREMGTIDNALTLITRGHDIVDAPNATSLQVSKGEIYFDKVTFAYQKNRPVFEELNVVIPAGQKIGLVGFSGSGKSTFVNLILRSYDLTLGRIMIDNQNIADVTQDSLRAQIAMIPQDPTLFHRTLRENIAYGCLHATEEEILQASKLAYCHEFIEKLAEGYDALVGERGIKLSGGQRQRIAIARAILKNAPLLILDEATSSLDSVTEKMIQESLQNLMQHRTTIVVAHRLSTLANMDRILVFHQGKIIEDGTKDSLLKAKGHFAMLWNMQTDGFLP